MTSSQDTVPQAADHNHSAKIDEVVAPPVKATRRKARAIPAVDMSRIAAQLQQTTKSAAKIVLQEIGVAPTEEQIDELLECQRRVQSRRAHRHQQNAELRLGHKIRFYPPVPTGRKPVCLPTRPLLQRLAQLRIQALSKVAKELFRNGAAGGTSIRVGYASTSQEVRYAVTIGSNYDTYRGAYKGWSANEDHHQIVVPKDWRLRVLKQGIAAAGGMMTLDAHALEAPAGFRLFAAVWASQGRGFAVKTERGFIASCADEVYHSDTAEKAISGVRCKVASVNGTSIAGVKAYTIGITQFVDKFSQVECSVELADARETGSCEFGILSWCNAVGLDYKAGAAPLKRVLDAFRVRPQIEVRRAVLNAVRRHRVGLRLDATNSGESE